MSRKRAAVGALVPHDVDSKHASLMQDYLLLQDEFAALKDRVQSAKIRKATLLAEVRFLRRRLKKLKETPSIPRDNETTSAIAQPMGCSGKPTSRAPMPESIMTHKNNLLDSTKVPASREQFRTNDTDQNSQQKPFNGNVGLVSALKTSVFGNRSNMFVTAIPEKRKISWQDQISLECK
ncbi:hypothetical protein SUGI_0996040 [Cryptomeria japonica]|uniref:uncharacterized protein LOC131072553 n=1 Tax=Cryptomeria japonica TaxID=3369 RepID=UPI002414BDAD|nr:uncharacterized protein LOC131072553 [Cryptomeria japonica]GLJ47184.1 hypothetical protein SUGI_0996040 [Cryptomeria japonica]